MRVYYNDNDPYVAQWLRNLVAAGLVPAGHVDDRSILDVRPSDLDGYDQCHWFAGIAGWSLALQLAEWPSDRSVWTGSCPCQPFSAAGKQGGSADARHLWPEWFRLIRERRPDSIFGEQVAGSIGFGWIDRVFADLEACGYACGAAVLGAHSINAPHIRQRLFWVAQSANGGCESREGNRGIRLPTNGAGEWTNNFGGSVASGGVAHAEPQLDGSGNGGVRRRPQSANGGDIGGLGNADTAGPQGRHVDARERDHQRAPGPAGDAFWSDTVWLPCLDGKARRTLASIFPLVDVWPRELGSRVGILRAAGNSIVVPLAAEFVRAVMEAKEVGP